MILHCYYCALGGDRPTNSSKVAIVKNLHKPLQANMFEPLDPKHDPSPPFNSDEWRFMLHKACGKYPWPYDVDPIEGPSQILTDKGLVKIPDAVVDVVDVVDVAAVVDVVEVDIKPVKPKRKQIQELLETGLKQTEIAKKLDVTPQYVNKIAKKMKNG
jgi:hypothetical protein